MTKHSSFPASYSLKVSSAIMSKSIFSLLSGWCGVWAILALSDVSSILPTSSESLAVFQVFKATFQLDTNIPGKSVMASWCESNNATSPTGEQCAMFYLDVGNICPPWTSPSGGRWNATGDCKRLPSENTHSFPFSYQSTAQREVWFLCVWNDEWLIVYYRANLFLGGACAQTNPPTRERDPR